MNTQIPLLLFPDPTKLYQRRQQRLLTLAADSPISDYLIFAAAIAGAQHHIQHNPPPAAKHRACLTSHPTNTPALHYQHFALTAHWQQLLTDLLNTLQPQLTGQARCVLNALIRTSAHQRQQMAQALLHHQFSRAGSDKAPFIWAALSVYWSQQASQIRAQPRQTTPRQHCPLCGGMPVIGIIHGGKHQGLRYLHCTLCESQWHLVRLTCSNCQQTDALSYWSLDSEHAAIKGESCEHCHSYLKLLYQNKQSQLDPIADDLASLPLDSQLERQGYARSAFNPLLFPAESLASMDKSSIGIT